ncbi:unnamed protein product [Linum trigynum]|uniref:Uncharacterized protein n=1 Tax=Linum trigynum TaxID=586398 RepID=A0AAV2DXQ9_9ROSI
MCLPSPQPKKVAAQASAIGDDAEMGFYRWGDCMFCVTRFVRKKTTRRAAEVFGAMNLFADGDFVSIPVRIESEAHNSTSLDTSVHSHRWVDKWLVDFGSISVAGFWLTRQPRRISMKPKMVLDTAIALMEEEAMEDGT